MGNKATIEVELNLISALERGEVVSQADLSKNLSVSVGLVNALLKRVIRKGLVKTRSAPYRRWAYYLTPTSFSEKSRLVARFLETSLDFFRKSRQEYGQIFLDLRRAGARRAMLAGRGELAEIAFLAAHENGIEIVGLLDAEMNDERFLGVPVFRTLDGVDPATALVLTASRHPQAAYDSLRSEAPERTIRAPALLRIRAEAHEADGTGVRAEAAS